MGMATTFQASVEGEREKRRGKRGHRDERREMRERWLAEEMEELKYRLGRS